MNLTLSAKIYIYTYNDVTSRALTRMKNARRVMIHVHAPTER